MLDIDNFFESNFARLNASFEERGGGLMDLSVGAEVARRGPSWRPGSPPCSCISVWSLYTSLCGRADVGMSSAEAARLICGGDVVLEADQPLLPTPSKSAPELIDGGVSAPVYVITPAYRWDQIERTKITLGSRSIRHEWPRLPDHFPCSIVDFTSVKI